MLEAILARLREQPSRTGSLIITLYGDAIAPRGGSLWLGSLLSLFRAIGVAEGVVRTAVSRAAADGWLDRAKIGRNGFYRLSARGQSDTETATPRIYGALNSAWGGRLRLALLDVGPERERIRASFADAGWGAALPGLMVAPDGAPTPVGHSLILAAEASGEDARRLALRAWPLDDLASRYRGLLDLLGAGEPPADPQNALVARTVLIHEWRRIVLRDPRLPSALLPTDWPGHEARRRTSALYEKLYAASEEWLDAHGATETGALPPAGDARRRFD